MTTVDRHNNFYWFTGSLVVLMLISSYAHSTSALDNFLLVRGILLLTQIVAFLTLGFSRRFRVFLAIMVVIGIAVNATTHFGQISDQTVINMLHLVPALLFFSVMTVAAAREALFTGVVEANTIIGTLAIYLLLGLVWAVLYLIILEFFPGAFNGIEPGSWEDNLSNAVYFSFVTMTTLGYGDISPAFPVSESLSLLQAVVGTFYMAIVVASLVGASTNTRKFG